MKGILGRKVGMTQLLTGNGHVVPVTVIEAGPCYITQIKTARTDGYTAIQLGYQETKPKRLTKGESAICAAATQFADVAHFARDPHAEHVEITRRGRSCWPTCLLRASGSMSRACPRVGVSRAA
jgi:ribosomal protein L3